MTFVVAGTSCEPNENITSWLNIVITDSPIDAQGIDEVNIVFTDVEWKKNGAWTSIQYIEEPIAVDVFSLRDGKQFPLINQYVEAGRHTEFRFSLRMVVVGSDLVVNPQSDIRFTDGTSQYLYWFDRDTPPVVVVETDVTLPERQFSRLVVDLDLRKSIKLNAVGDYVLEPVMRIVDESKTGYIRATVLGVESSDIHIVGYAYTQGSFSDSELIGTQTTIPFFYAITSSKLSASYTLTLPFLESGEYEVVLVTYDMQGVAQGLLKKTPNVSVSARETTKITINTR